MFDLCLDVKVLDAVFLRRLPGLSEEAGVRETQGSLATG